MVQHNIFLLMKNTLFNSTFVVRGNATAAVTAVGMNTEMGKIAAMLEDAKATGTPLENSLNKLGKIISGFVLAVTAIIFIMGIFVRGDGILKNFMTSVAVAVAESLISLGVDAQIKWPNDIMVKGRKISGILIEYNNDFVVVGIGVNIKSNPTVSASYKTTRLGRYCSASAMDVLGLIMKNLDIWRSADFEKVRTRWMALAMGINKMVEYRGESVQLLGINVQGALMLRRGNEDILGYGDEITINEK